MSCTGTALKTVGEVEKLTGISRRKVKYFIERGILRPSGRSESGYWLYSKEDMENLRLVWLAKELDYPDNALKAMLAEPNYTWFSDLDLQIAILSEKRQQSENKLLAARFLKNKLSKGSKPKVEDLFQEVLAIINGDDPAPEELS